MRANYTMQRLYVTESLAEGQAIAATPEQLNYLANVLRMGDGTDVLLFNGRDGEWKARLSFPAKKKLVLTPHERTREQPAHSDLMFLFAPLKVGRLDYLVQKAVEMGAGVPSNLFSPSTRRFRKSVWTGCNPMSLKRPNSVAFFQCRLSMHRSNSNHCWQNGITIGASSIAMRMLPPTIRSVNWEPSAKNIWLC